MDNPYQPPTNQSPAAPFLPEPPARPTSATVFGILNLVFGGMGLICTPVSLVALFVPQPAGAPENVALTAMKDPTYRIIMIAMVVAGVIMAVVECIAGVGLLRVRSWGRTLSTAYAGYALLMVPISLVVSYVYIVGPAVAAIQGKDDAAAAGAVGGAIGGMVGGVLGAIYPLLLLIFMNRAPIKRLYTAPKAPAGDAWS